jgi:hypothetical protein
LSEHRQHLTLVDTAVTGWVKTEQRAIKGLHVQDSIRSRRRLATWDS